MVGPTNEKPRFLRSRDIAREASVSAGIPPIEVHRFWIGLPPTNDQRYRSKSSIAR